MAATVLVVDDDPHIREVVRFALDKSGFAIVEAGDGKAALSAFGERNADLIVLDVGLPELDGLGVCREIRKSSDVPILFLSSHDSEVDRILGLEIGGDDYVAKPFSPRELVGRIKAILRRTSHMPRDPDLRQVNGYRFGDWQLDNTTRALSHSDGAKTDLSGAEFRLLSVLLSHATRVLSRAQLMELVRGRELDPFDRSIDVRISRLRQTLRDDARSPRIIKTIYGEGYVIGVPVEQY